MLITSATYCSHAHFARKGQPRPKFYFLKCEKTQETQDIESVQHLSSKPRGTRGVFVRMALVTGNRLQALKRYMPIVLLAFHRRRGSIKVGIHRSDDVIARCFHSSHCYHKAKQQRHRSTFRLSGCPCVNRVNSTMVSLQAQGA